MCSLIGFGCITDKTDQLPPITADMIDPENPSVPVTSLYNIA